MRTNRKNSAFPFRSPKHIRWDRHRADKELLRIATEYGKCWNPMNWDRLTQGYYDGFEDARTEYRRLHDEDVATITAHHRAEIQELKANWIPPDEADEAIQKIYALRKERDELLECMELLRKIGFPAIRQKKQFDRFMHCAKSAINSAGLWTCLPKRPNGWILGTFIRKFCRSCLRFAVKHSNPLLKSMP